MCPRCQWRAPLAIRVAPRMPHLVRRERALPHEAAIAAGETAREGAVARVYAEMGLEVEALREWFAAAGKGAAVLRLAARLGGGDCARGGVLVGRFDSPPRGGHGRLHGVYIDIEMNNNGDEGRAMAGIYNAGSSATFRRVLAPSCARLDIYKSIIPSLGCTLENGRKNNTKSHIRSLCPLITTRITQCTIHNRIHHVQFCTSFRVTETPPTCRSLLNISQTHPNSGPRNTVYK